MRAWCVLGQHGDYLPRMARSVDPVDGHSQNKHKASTFGRVGFLLPFPALKQAWFVFGQQKAPALQGLLCLVLGGR